MAFGDRLKSLRLEKGLSQRELGDLIGISDRVVGYYEANDRFPKDEILLKNIADFFNVSMDDLLDMDNNIKQLPYEKFMNTVKVHFMNASPEDQAAIFNDITDIYFESKQINKEKYNPNKNKVKDNNSGNL